MSLVDELKVSTHYVFIKVFYEYQAVSLLCCFIHQLFYLIDKQAFHDDRQETTFNIQYTQHD